MATITPASPSRKQIAKVTSKGQITIPAEVRESMGVKAGDKLIFERSADGEMFIKKAEQFPFDKFRGMGTGIPELEANPESIINYIRELRGHDEFDHID
jgi:AbrB family looped-hinge helix DNA binding protein